MGRASTIGSLASIIAFGAGLYLGVNAPFPWPLAWAAGITAGIALSFVTSIAFELVDHRKRYGLNFAGTHVTHEVDDGWTVTDCFSCSGADPEGYRVAWSKDDVFLGMVRERHGGGYSYYCSTCHEDAIEAGLRAGRERDFREWYDGEDHYMEALCDLRETFIEREELVESEVDFWEWVDMLMAFAERRDARRDPREYSSSSLGRLEAAAETNEQDDDEPEDEPERELEGPPVTAGEGTELEGLPDEFY